MGDARPTFFADLKVFLLRLRAHWREIKTMDLLVVLMMAGLGALAAKVPWWVTVVVLTFWVAMAVAVFRVWRMEHAALLQAQGQLAVRARLEALHGLLEEGWRLEPLVLHLPTTSGWTMEKLRGVIERVGRPVLDWQARVRKELEMGGLGAVAQWDGVSGGMAGVPVNGENLEGDETDLLEEVVRIRTGYFRRVPLLKNIVASVRS